MQGPSLECPGHRTLMCCPCLVLASPLHSDFSVVPTRRRRHKGIYSTSFWAWQGFMVPAPVCFTLLSMP